MSQTDSPPNENGVKAKNSRSRKSGAACRRCHILKCKCDSKYPNCSRCEKAGTPCTYFDHLTKREVPRNYLVKMEDELNYLKSILIKHRIPFQERIGSYSAESPGPEAGHLMDPVRNENRADSLNVRFRYSPQSNLPQGNVQLNAKVIPPHNQSSFSSTVKPHLVNEPSSTSSNITNEVRLSNNSIANLTLLSMSHSRDSITNAQMTYGIASNGKSETGTLPMGPAETSFLGLSLLRENTGGLPSNGLTTVNGDRPDETPRSNFLISQSLSRQATPGIPNSSLSRSINQTQLPPLNRILQPHYQQRTLPRKHIAERLIKNYINYAFPQMPVLKAAFVNELFDFHYSQLSHDQVPTSHSISSCMKKNLFFLYIVFAIGSGVAEVDLFSSDKNTNNRAKIGDLSEEVGKPESYYLASQVCLSEAIAESNHNKNDRISNLENVQILLLLCNYGFLRPVNPGIWYLISTAIKSCIDMNLHEEAYHQRSMVEILRHYSDLYNNVKRKANVANEMELDQVISQFKMSVYDTLWKRIIFWTAYNLDRQIGSYVNRPFTIDDYDLTVEMVPPDPGKMPKELYMSLLKSTRIQVPDEIYSGLIDSHRSIFDDPVFSSVTINILKLRMIQSEIQKVLFRSRSLEGLQSPYKVPFSDSLDEIKLSTPFLKPGESLAGWKERVNTRLDSWLKDCPKSAQESGCLLPPQFLTLSYYQLKLDLYRPTLKIQSSQFSDLNIQAFYSDWANCIAFAKEIINHYRWLHQNVQINYFYLTIHNVFTSGMSLLYSYSNLEKHAKRFGLENHVLFSEIEQYCGECINLFTYYIHRCPPAENCRKILQSCVSKIKSDLMRPDSVSFAKDQSADRSVGHDYAGDSNTSSPNFTSEISKERTSEGNLESDYSTTERNGNPKAKRRKSNLFTFRNFTAANINKMSKAIRQQQESVSENSAQAGESEDFELTENSSDGNRPINPYHRFASSPDLIHDASQPMYTIESTENGLDPYLGLSHHLNEETFPLFDLMFDDEPTMRHSRMFGTMI